MLIDSHTHIDLIEPDLAGQIAVVHKSLENGIAHLIQISTNIDSFLNSLQLRQKFPSVISIALGYPPFYSKEKTDPIIRNIKQTIIAIIAELIIPDTLVLSSNFPEATVISPSSIISPSNLAITLLNSGKLTFLPFLVLNSIF